MSDSVVPLDDEPSMLGEEWPFEVGQTLTRVELHRRLGGGQQQTGISTPRNSKNILLFTTKATGVEYGYATFEGLQEDGSYLYTGEGRTGDQEFKRGNFAVLKASEHGKALRVFVVEKQEVTYVGEFALGTPQYLLEAIEDVDGGVRQGIVFRLVPVEADLSLLMHASAQLHTQDVGVEVHDWLPPDSDPVKRREGLRSASGEILRDEHRLQVLAVVGFDDGSVVGVGGGVEGECPAHWV